MTRWWRSLGVQEKLHILIQGSLIFLFFISVDWVVERFDAQITASVKARAVEAADGLVNGMNMMMLTGAISKPENRLLLLKKMGLSKGVKELRIIRAKQVQDQYGPGLPEEQAVDDTDREVIATGKTVFMRLEADDGSPMLRVVVPIIAQEDFRGTNCLDCHSVQPGSVNGAASVLMDLTEEEANIAEIKKLLWLGQLAIQVLLSIIIAIFVRVLVIRNIAKPVEKLRAAMTDIQRDGDLSKRAEIDENNADIGDMAKAFNALLESLQTANKRLDMFAEVFENSGEAIVITDAERNVLAVNQAFVDMTGYSQEEILGKNPKILSSGRQTAEFYQEMWHSINETGQWKGEIWNRRRNGEIYPEWLSIGTVKDEEGKVVSYISIFTDITHRKLNEQRIQHMAHYDSLTQLPNRALFNDRIQQALTAAKRNKSKLAVMFLDLDRFKSINDSLGHLAGDLLLKSVSGRLLSCVRESDTVCRQGGDEFIILLPDMERVEDALHVAEKIVAAMADAHSIEGEFLNVTFSIGISMYPSDGLDSTTLLKNADVAMYHAKEKGRNNFQFFAEEMNAESGEQLAIEADLRHALQRGEFQLHYQPQIHNQTGDIVGMEALIRWRHAERGLVAPGKFIPIAEECGLISQIGEWVLRTACLQNKKWQDEGLIKVPVAVNLSAYQFHQKDIRATVERVLLETGLEGRYLELEITEGVAMRDVESAISILNEFKNMGILLAIDDFGTGYSSLNYLKRFPIDKLKIDGSFVRDITTDADDAAIVQTIIAMGHSLRLKVIAEGVEMAEQFAFLRGHQCDEIQGYYFSKPLEADDFAKYVKSYQLGSSGTRPWIVPGDLHSVGIAEIDRDHLELVAMVNKMDEALRSDAPPENFAKMLDELIVHIRAHFAMEERLMSSSDYPGGIAHRKEHALLLDEVCHLRGRLDYRIERVILQSVKDWISTHIEHTDKLLASHIEDNGRCS